MDRRYQTLAGLGLAFTILASSAGCRSTGNEVPPGRRHRHNHEPGTPAVEFSTQPPETRGLPSTGPLGGGMGNLAPSTANTSGLAPYGAPAGAGFGPPGSSGLSPGTGGALGTQPAKIDPSGGLPPLSGEAPRGNPLESVGGLPPGTP